MTKEEILHMVKDEVANEHSRDTFEELLIDMSECEGDDGLKWFEKVLDEVATRYAAAMCQLQIQACIGEVITAQNVAEK